MTRRNETFLACLLMTGMAMGQARDLPAEDVAPPVPEGLMQVLEVVNTSAASGKDPARELAALGEASVPSLLASLGPVSPLNDDARIAVERALARLGAVSVYPHLRAVMGEEPTMELRMRALRVAGVVGGRGS